MIYIAFGSNLSVGGRSPVEVVRAAVATLQRHGVALPAVSSLWRTEPVPAANQPDYANAVARAETALSPADLLALLHRVEAEFGRVRGEANAARGLDLDLIDYDSQVSVPGGLPILPHPRMHQRAFVLRPLSEIAPHWRHPVSGRAVDDLIAALPAGQMAEILEK